jgi:UTP--glucose-1-phosphate uridylyltransferase
VQLGLGDAVLCAKNIIGNEFFAVLLADELMYGEGSSCLQQMLDGYQQTQSSIIAVQAVLESEVSRYGIVGFKKNQATDLKRMNAMIEKPEPAVAPSHLAAIGRYILSPRIFNILEQIEVGKGSEIQLTDAISRLLLQENVYAHTLQGRRYDCGSKLGYIQATIDFALEHPEIAAGVREHLLKKKY